MTDLNCEDVLVAAMAIADGYQPGLSVDEIEAHLAGCVICRTEIGEQRALSRLLNEQERRQWPANVWKQVDHRLPGASPESKTPPARYTLILLGVLLLGYRMVEMIPDRDSGFALKFLPILLVIAAFSYLRENPFKINTQLRLEGE